ncbi:MAG: hypothetical protein ACM3IJ_02765, partial [Candidatus Levyibacteriota bacterium]
DSYKNDFYYDASRVPVRLLIAARNNNDANAQTILTRQASFLSGVGQQNLKSGYTLSGSPLTTYYDTTFQTAYTAAAQINSSSSFAQGMLSSLVNTSPGSYFGTSLRTVFLLMLSRGI